MKKTKIDRFKELIELAEMVRDNSNMAWDLSTIGPKLLALVDAAGKMTQYVSGENSDSCFTRDFNALCDQYEALAKLKEDE